MKKKLWSKAIALLTTICMVLSICPLTAFAANADTPPSGETAPTADAETQYANGFAADGSYQPAVQAEDGVYEIGNAGQLYWFARLVNGYYNSASDCAVGQNAANARLTADITVNETVNESARTWMPICSESLRYQGTFDGNGHSISGLYFPGSSIWNDDSYDAEHYAAAVVVYEKNGGVMKNGDVNGDTDVGLFGFIDEKGVVKNITVKDSVFKNGYMDIGAIAGTNDGIIQNCKSANNTVYGNHSVGGIVGCNGYTADTVSLTNCENSSHVTALSQGGGIAGANSYDGTIENCTNNGTVDGTDKIGGIVGSNSSKIADCENNGAVTATGDYAGGIAAAMGNAEVVNCTNHGTVIADSTAKPGYDGYFIGGIAGMAQGNTTVANCTNTGDVSSAGGDVGGIVGRLEGTSSVKCSSNSGTITAKTYSGGIVGRMSYSGPGSVINNCFNTGKVTTAVGGYHAGGIVGQNGRASTTDTDNSSCGGSVKNSWNSGEVTIPGSYSVYAGGIYGTLYGAGTVENCYYLDTSAERAGASTTSTVREPDEMTAAQNAEVFASGKIAWYLNHAGGNAETVWYQNVDNDKTHDAYPVLDNKSAVVYACGSADTAPAVAYTNMADADHDSHTMKWAYTAENHWQTCTRCGAKTTEVKHTFGEWTVIRAATASVPGVEQRSCTDCGFTEQRDINEAELPTGTITKSVEVKNGAPATTMNTSKTDLMNNILTDNEKTAVAGGANAHIWLEVNALNENDVPEKDKTATAAQAKQLVGENAQLTYLDISLYKQMSGNAQEQLHQSAAPLSVTITIPESIRTAANGMRRTFYVLRSHTENGQTSCTTINGTYDSTTGAFTFATDRFSTYALVYKDTAISSGGHSSGSSAAATYPVDVKTAANGTIKADKSSASKGSTVTITVTPNKGYELGKLTVTDKNGKTVSVIAKGSGRYSFTMPDGKVTVAASFAETDWDLAYRDCPKDNTCPIWPFTDAKTTDWYHDGVHFCLENKLMVGYGANTFKPNNSTSRAMLTVMLWRLSGSPTVNYAMQFSDVDSGKWYTEAVRWAASTNVVTGFTDGTFRPDSAVTREQMAAVLYRYAQSKNYDVSVGENTNILSYADAANVSKYAIPAMQWACGSGMIQGTNGNLNPNNSTSRAQMATMMMRFCAEIVK